MTHRDDSMTGRVTRIRHELPVSNEIKAAVSGLDAALAAAIDVAKAAGLPKGCSLPSCMDMLTQRRTRWC